MVGWIFIIAGLLVWLFLGYVGWSLMIEKNYIHLFGTGLWWFGSESLFYISPTGLFCLLLGLWLPDKEWRSAWLRILPSADKLYCHYLRLKHGELEEGLGFLSVGPEGLTFRSARPAARSPDRKIPLLQWSCNGLKSYGRLKAYGPKIPEYECFFPFGNIQDAQLLTRDLVPKDLHIRFRMVGRSNLVLKITMEDKEQEDEYFWSHAKYFRGVINKELIGGGTSRRREKRSAYPAPSKEYGEYENQRM